jgi:hypothetical protein
MDNKLGERVTELRRQVRDLAQVVEHKEGSRLVHHRDVGTIVRGIGYNPSEDNLSQILEVVRLRKLATHCYPVAAAAALWPAMAQQKQRCRIKGCMIRARPKTVCAGRKSAHPTHRHEQMQPRLLPRMGMASSARIALAACTKSWCQSGCARPCTSISVLIAHAA